MTTKILTSLTIVAALAGSAFAGLQVTDPSLASAPVSGILSPGTKPTIGGGAGLLLVPNSGASGLASAGLNSARPRILRVTP
jgi:hypothetical protein